MAYKIAERIEAHRSPSAADLRRVFETAVCEIHQTDLAAQSELQYRTPVVQRARILGISRASAERRAMTDAARALAQLWKVRANPAREVSEKAGLSTQSTGLRP